MFFVLFFLLGRYVFSMFPPFCWPCFHLKPWRLGIFTDHHKDSMAFDANHGGVPPLAAWMKVLRNGKWSNEEKGPWLFAVNKGMKHYPVMLEVFHKP